MLVLTQVDECRVKGKDKGGYMRDVRESHFNPGIVIPAFKLYMLAM